MAQHSKSRDLANLMKFQILSGKYRPGSQLPSVNALALQHDTTLATVTKALDYLEQQGLIDRLAGKGVFIREKFQVRIAVVIDNLFACDALPNAFLPVALQEIDRKCREYGWALELFFNVKNAGSAREFKTKVKNNAFDVVFVDSLYIAEHYDEIFADISVLTIGLYGYKQLNSWLSFGTGKFICDAVFELDRLGCREIVLLDIDRDLDWMHLGDVSLVNIYRDAMLRVGRNRENMHEYRVDISPQGGRNVFLQMIKDGLGKNGPLGVISRDSVITDGVIVTAMLYGLKLPTDLVIASTDNRGHLANLPSVPMIAYYNEIGLHMDRIFADIDRYMQGGIPPCGADSIEPVKEFTATWDGVTRESFQPMHFLNVSEN